MATKEQLEQALSDLWERYGNLLSMLDDSLDKLDEKPKEVVREVVVPLATKQEKAYQHKIKQLTAELKAKPKEIIKEVTVVEHVPKEIHVEVTNKEVEDELRRQVEELQKELAKKPKEIVKEIIKEKIVEGPRRPVEIEKPSSGDLREAARLMATSELNKEDLTEKEIFDILMKSSQEEVNTKLGFWAVPLPKTDDSDNDDPSTRYRIKT
jgi:hypothetical protein